MNYTLKPFQVEGANFLANNKQAILCDEMRMGKSAQAIAAADIAGHWRILITCPASVKITWEREIPKWSNAGRSVQIIYGKKGHIDPTIDVTIINYDICSEIHIYTQLMELNFDVIIIDEFHYLKGMESQRTEAILCHGIASRAKCHWGLSGTPILNRPIEIFPIAQSLKPEILTPYNSYKSFAQHFCGGHLDTTTQKFFDKGATNKEELRLRLNSGFMLRRLRKDHLDELPKDYQIISVDPDKEAQSLLAEEFRWSKEEAKYQELDAGTPIATLRKELAISKIPHMLKHIKYLMTVEEKIVVGGYTRDVMKALYHGLSKYNPAIIGGGMSAAKKQENSDRFRDDPECRIMLGQIYAAGEGQDFCAARMILLVEVDWVPGKLDQFSDRCSGFNQKFAVQIQYLVYEGSLDEHQLRVVIDKKEVIQDCIEDDEDFSGMFG